MNLGKDPIKVRYAGRIFAMVALSALLSIDNVGAFASWSTTTTSFSPTRLSQISLRPITISPSIMTSSLVQSKLSKTKITSTLESTEKGGASSFFQKAANKIKARPGTYLMALTIAGFLACKLTNPLAGSTLSGGNSVSTLLALRGGQATCPPLDPVPVPARFDPLIQKFLPGHEQHPNVIAAVLFGFALAPLSKIYYEKIYPMVRKKVPVPSIKKGKGDGADSTPKQPVDFYRTKFYRTVETIIEAARLFLTVAIFDVFITFISCVGLKLPMDDHLTNIFALGAYLLWGFGRVSRFKYYVLKKTMRRMRINNDEKRLYIINRFADYALAFFGVFAFYEVLNVELGYSAKSLLAVFSFASAAIALATKDIITNFLNGVILSASDRIFVGDYVSIQGDIKTVKKLGWLETKLRGSDNVLYTIPNTELVKSKLANLSRVHTSQVAQTLQLPYSTIDQLPKIFDDIKAEIQKSCPTIITDGSHPFQCYWVNFGKDHVEVRVNVHFRISPVGDRYYENRQECLMAIDRAIRNNEIEKYSGSK